ncbi:MAG: FIST C-terminal domain-containing protein, partial [Vicinamibacteria bacterium]
AREPLLRDLQRAAAFLYVGLPAAGATGPLERGKYLVRSIVGFDPGNGIVAVAEPIEEGRTISFTLRDADRARGDLKDMLGELSALHGPTAGAALYFNCCARGQSLYGIPDIDTAFIKSVFGELPLAGFFGYAELGPVASRNYLHNYSGVLVLLSDSPA